MARPDPNREVPEGYELAAAEDPAWRLVAGKPCRSGAHPGVPACARPSVAELNRAHHDPRARAHWWAYCEDHLYGRWIEDGKVMHWILRASDA